MSIDAALNASIETVPDCIAAGYLDMETGMFLGIQGHDAQGREALDHLSLAIANLFQGRGVKGFETLLNQAAEAGDQSDGFGEIAVFTKERLHIFLRTRLYPNHVVCYVCRDSVNIGLALTKSQLSLGEVTAAV